VNTSKRVEKLAAAATLLVNSNYCSFNEKLTIANSVAF